jgi:hypothetical protein
MTQTGEESHLKRRFLAACYIEFFEKYPNNDLRNMVSQALGGKGC